MNRERHLRINRCMFGFFSPPPPRMCRYILSRPLYLFFRPAGVDKLDSVSCGRFYDSAVVSNSPWLMSKLVLGVCCRSTTCGRQTPAYLFFFAALEMTFFCSGRSRCWKPILFLCSTEKTFDPALHASFFLQIPLPTPSIFSYFFSISVERWQDKHSTTTTLIQKRAKKTVLFLQNNIHNLFFFYG